MADFCKQCSTEILCEDFRDMAGIAKNGEIAFVICEGCGFTWVNEDGECVGNCDRKHGSTSIPTGSS